MSYPCAPELIKGDGFPKHCAVLRERKKACSELWSPSYLDNRHQSHNRTHSFQALIFLSKANSLISQ